MVGDGDEIQRPLDLVQAAIDHDLPALGKAVGVVGGQAVSGDEGIHRHAGLDVLLAEIRLLQRVLRHVSSAVCAEAEEIDKAARAATLQKPSKLERFIFESLR